MQQQLGDVVASIPKLLAFLAILLIGYFVAKAVAKATNANLERVGFDNAVERGGVKQALARSQYDASDVLAKSSGTRSCCSSCNWRSACSTRCSPSSPARRSSRSRIRHRPATRPPGTRAGPRNRGVVDDPRRGAGLQRGHQAAFAAAHAAGPRPTTATAQVAPPPVQRPPTTAAPPTASTATPRRPRHKPAQLTSPDPGRPRLRPAPLRHDAAKEHDMATTMTHDDLTALPCEDVYGNDGDNIGSLEQIYLDNDSGDRVGVGQDRLLREQRQPRAADRCQHGRQDPAGRPRQGHVKDAPGEPDRELSEREEQRLYEHYGLAYGTGRR